MCGRFGFINIQQSDGSDYWTNLWDEEGTSQKDRYIENFFSKTRYDIRPTQIAPVITASQNNGYQVSEMQWGFQPVWSKSPLINARIEKIPESRLWTKPLEERRCLVPASFFYEWQDVGLKKNVPWLIKKKGAASFVFAGLYTREKDQKSGNDVQRFTILTQPANKTMAEIHNHGGNRHRQPVILPDKLMRSWLDETSDKMKLMTIAHHQFMDDDIETEMLETIGNDKTHAPPVPASQLF